MWASRSNYEGGYAKLLSDEDIFTVHDPKATTASFNPKTRVMIFPVFKPGTSSRRKNMFALHESGHALWFTDVEAQDAKYRKRGYKLPHTLANIVEDIMIENRLRKKFDGAAAILRDGYEEVFAEGFFGDPRALHAKYATDMMHPYDFFNIFGKAGPMISKMLPRNESERAICELIGKCFTEETRDKLAAMIHAYYLEWKKAHSAPKKESKKGEPKEKKNEPPKPAPQESDSEPNVSEPDDEEESENEGNSSETSNTSVEANSDEGEEVSKPVEKGEGESEEDSEGETDENDSEPSKKEGGSDAGMNNSPQELERDEEQEDVENIEPETQKNYEDHQKEDFVDGNENKQIEVKSYKDDEFYNAYLNVVVPISNMERFAREHVTAVRNLNTQDWHYSNSRKKRLKSFEEWSKFDQDTTTEAAEIAGRFNQMLTGINYAESKLEEVGDLDFDRLFEYRTSDNIFIDQLLVDNVQSHGIVMMIDASGSMKEKGKFKKVFRQSVVLAKFCRLANIPFEVIAFGSQPTNELLFGNEFKGDHSKTWARRAEIQEQIFDSLLKIKSDFIRPGSTQQEHIELLSSRSSPTDFENIVRVLHASMYKEEYLERPFSLGGTPMYAALLAMPSYLNKFKETNRISNVALMVLTDGGDSDSVTYGTYNERAAGSQVVETMRMVYNIDFNYTKNEGDVDQKNSVHNGARMIVDAATNDEFILCMENVAKLLKQKVSGLKFFGYFINSSYMIQSIANGHYRNFLNTNMKLPDGNRMIQCDCSKSNLDMATLIYDQSEYTWVNQSHITRDEFGEATAAIRDFELTSIVNTDRRMFADQFIKIFS